VHKQELHFNLCGKLATALKLLSDHLELTLARPRLR
jgi:hypothetical protein